MATTNPVYQVLTTSGNAAPLSAGNKVTDLAVGQIGVFNYHTGLSLGAASIVGDTRDIFLAVGVDPLGVGSLQDIVKSAGQVIQVRNAKSFTAKAYVPTISKVIDITNFKAKCETDYALKIEFKSPEITSLNGQNQFAKTFNYFTGCCTDNCATCADGDCNDLALGFVKAINADADALAIASLIDYTTTPGTPVAVAEGAAYDTWVADVANAGKCLGIRITGAAPTTRISNGSINLGYFNNRGTNMFVSLVEGFDCNGTVATKIELQYAEGKGYDLAQLEYVAGGWNGKPGPYRQSSVTGLERDGFVGYINKTANYTQLSLTYDQMSVGGWLEYLNNLETIIAIPCADSTTLIGLVAILDVIFTQFAPMAGDVAGMDCTNLGTSTLTAATDGIESLS